MKSLDTILAGWAVRARLIGMTVVVCWTGACGEAGSGHAISEPLEGKPADATTEADEIESDSAGRLPCTYLPQRSEFTDLHDHGHSGHLDAGHQPEINSFSDCAARLEGKLQIGKRHLAVLSYDEHGLGQMLIAGQWHYVRADGDAVAVVTWDNGPDDFAEGLARAHVDGKMTYLNRSFDVVIPPTYDWGWPFDQGLALVCRGCQFERAVGEEHTAVVGGDWGYIDQAGREVVAVRYSRDEARAELAATVTR